MSVPEPSRIVCEFRGKIHTIDGTRYVRIPALTARLGRDRFAVIIEPGGLPADTHNTRADAQRVIDRPDSWLRRQYNKEAAAVLSRDGAAVLS